MTKDLTKVNNVKPYKAIEFQKFIESVGDGTIPETWEKMAEALGVTPKTIVEWKKLPQFQEARIRGIEESWRMMKKAGRNDWKMWRERYAMLTNENTNPVIAIQNNMSVSFVEDEIQTTQGTDRSSE